MMRVLPLSRSTTLVELAGLEEVLALHASLVLEPLPGIEELLPAAQTLMIRFDPTRLTLTSLAEVLSRRPLSARSIESDRLVEIPMRYDGEDLARVAELSGLAVDEVIRRHAQSEFTVAFCGFAPGFAYLVGGDPALRVPRRETPRTRVPAGSVALGGVYCGVYPQASPGGWQIIGTTSMPMWDPARDPPALLTPGTRVRFLNSPASASRDLPPVPPTTPPRRDLEGSPCIQVIAAGLPALVQDLGRAGYAKIGVTASGALDRGALQAANGALGNPLGLPCLEITLGNFQFECTATVTIAVAGAPLPISVQHRSGEIFDCSMEQPIRLGPGDRVKLGYPGRGVRTYLAIRGGFDALSVLGSASRDTLAAIGPQPVVKGSILRVGRGGSSTDVSDGVIDREERVLPASVDTVVLDIVTGPRADWFTEASHDVLVRQSWRVTPQSSRVGMRLQGELALERSVLQELPSEGTTRGAIQVPPDGQPILLLADHPVTGGYPVIAVVAEHHLDLAGQIPPGAHIRFRLIER